MHTAWQARISGVDVAKTLRFRGSSRGLLKRSMGTAVYEDKPKLPRVYTPSPETRPVALRTLYSGWLKAEDYTDLSDARGVLVDQQSGAPAGQSFNAPYITYGRAELKQQDKLLIKYFPFPVNTRGHLYYHRNHRFPIAGGLRFRLTQTPAPNQKEFGRAQDLLTEYGTPWEIPLIAIASNPRLKVVQDLLRQDGFLPEGVLERCQDMCERAQAFARVGPFTQLVYDTMQPFHLNLARPMSGVTLVGENNLIQLTLGRHMFPMVRPSENPFKSGILLCRFEHQGPPFVLMRVLRVIEPVRMADGYDGPIGEPVVNDLVRYKGKPMIFLQNREGQGRATYNFWQHREPNSKWAWLWNWLLYRKRVMRQGIHFPYDKEAVPPASRTP